MHQRLALAGYLLRPPFKLGAALLQFVEPPTLGGNISETSADIAARARLGADLPLQLFVRGFAHRFVTNQMDRCQAGGLRQNHRVDSTAAVHKAYPQP